MQLLLGLLTCFVFCTIIIQAEANVLNNIVATVNKNSITTCIAKLTNKFVRCGALVMLVDKVNIANPLIISLSYDCNSIILRSKHTHSRLPRPDVYIISSIDVIQFALSINELSREVAWNPKARFFLTIQELEKEEIFEVFEILLSHNIFDVLLIIDDKRQVIKVYNYVPFDNRTCGQINDDVIIEEDCDCVDIIEYDFKALENKFQYCSIFVAASEDILNFIYKTNTEFSYLGDNPQGIEQYMLQNIAKLENIRIKYLLAGQDMRSGVILPNHTVTGVLGYLQNNTVSIAGGGFMLIRNRAEMFDFIWGYNYANMILFTPAFRDENWRKIYQEFSTSTWLLIFLSFLFTTAVVTVVHKLSLGKTDDKISLVIKIWGYIYGHTDFGLYQVKKMRMIIVTWVLYTYFISSFYNTAYYSLLTRIDVKKMREKPNNLQSFPLKPCLTDSARIFFKFNFNETLPGKRTTKCQYTKSALDLVANSDNYYTIDLDYIYKIREYKYIDKEGNHKLQKLQYSSDMIFAMYTKRGFPLLPKFQRYAAYHFESGIFQKHLDEIFHRNQIFHKRNKSKYRNSRLGDYKIPFYILFVGYFISTICFIVETIKRTGE